MKTKLIALASLAVCGSSAFALTCDMTNALTMTNTCAPASIVNVMGASAQQPAIEALLGRGDGTIFDTTKPLAVISNSDGGVVATTGTGTGVGAKNTKIFFGTGAGLYNAKTNPNGGKLLAVVTNFANGSFSGLNAMVNTVKTPAAGADVAGTAKGGVYFNETISTKLLTAADTAALNCTGGTTAPTLAAGTPSATTFGVTCTTNNGTTGDRSLTRDYVQEIVGKAPRGVQLVTMDVPPEFATPGVVSASYKAGKAFPLTETGVQGFGVAVNDKLLAALVARDIASQKLASSCSAVTGFATLTPGCQPSISSVEMAQFVNGTGSAATLFGATDTTPVVYYRRTPFSGTQAVSNIAFGGQGASKDTKALAGYYTKATNSFMGYSTPVLGDINTTTGNYQFVGTGLTVNGMVGSGDVLSGIGSSTNATSYALGLVSLEKKAAISSTGVLSKIDGKGGAWIKVDGISPNSNGTTFDAKQRVGFANGYPLQFNTVVATNGATKDVGQSKVVSALVNGMKDPAYDLPGVAYLDKTAVNAAGASVAAKYTRTINAYAPLHLN